MNQKLREEVWAGDIDQGPGGRVAICLSVSSPRTDPETSFWTQIIWEVQEALQGKWKVVQEGKIATKEAPLSQLPKWVVTKYFSPEFSCHHQKNIEG